MTASSVTGDEIWIFKCIKIKVFWETKTKGLIIVCHSVSLSPIKYNAKYVYFTNSFNVF